MDKWRSVVNLRVP